MGERSISTQVRIDGDVVPSFAGWELRFKGERFVLPTVEPQAAKDTTTRNSLVDLTFESWIIQQLKRYYFFEPASIDTNTAIADKYVAPVRLSLSNFVALFNKVLKYYFGNSVQMSLFQGVGTDDPAIVEINYSYLWDVLGKMFEIYNVRWRIEYENSAYVIKVGYPADTINDHDFEYGYKGGLLRFERQVQDQDIRNILLGRGGEKNLPYRYFKKMDQQNTGWTPDPDAIPELANISFDRLRDVNFRWYVRGWMQNPLCDQAYAPYPTYDESQIPNDYKFAYLKGKTDDRFNPVEYVKDDDSIEKYGEHWGAVDNNDDIYPTIQGRSRSGLGRIDAVVDVSEIVTDDIEGASKAVSEVTNIGGVKSMSTSIASGQTVSKSFTGETFAVKAGMTGVITAMPFKEFGRNETQDAMVTMSLTVEVINASTGQVAATGSGQQITTGSIPTGTYYLRVTALLENHSLTDDLEGTFGLNEVKLQSAGYDIEEWKPTFDIWVKNIWGTTQGSGETDLAYTERVWLPILGDRAGNEAKVVFSDGFMSVSSDYEFVIAAYPVPDRTKTILVDGVEVQSEWKITLRKSDAEFEATGLYIPNSTTGGKPVAGDHFFFIGIDMPFDYVLWGEEDLNTYKAAQLDKTAQVNPTWVINLDKVRVHTLEQGEYDTVLADRLAAGATVHIKDKRFTGGDVLTLYVQSMTYTWNEPSDDKPYIVPDIEVVLSDKVVSRTSVVEQIQGDVDVIRTQYAKIDDIEGVVRRVASPLFLKKTGESDKSLSPTQFAGKVSSDDFRQGDVGGAGWGAYTDGDGNAVYEVDKLVVRKELRVNNLVANQISYVGGKQINSAASIECVQVREESDGYVCYFDQKRGSIANLFVVGDYAMGQIFNPNDVEERYYRRRVNEVGENYIKLSKATGQVDGSGVPQVGDIIVQYGHESNTARQYAIVRDVIGGGYESMLMGLNSASAAGTEYYMSGRKSSLTGPRWFVGDTAGQHAEYYNGVLNITGRLSVSSQIEKSSGVYVGLSQYLNSLQDQIDGNIQSWAGDDDPLPVEVEGSVDPSTANYPASAWTTDTDRLKHMGDIYVNNTTGQGWRYTRQANDGDFYWMRITDEELANALQRISALETSVAGLAYLKAATNQGTLVEGGLVLTSLIQLGQTVNNVFTVWAGINGILDTTLANPLKSIAAWYGGPMRDLEMEGSGSGSGSGVSYAKSLFRMDGSGYLAGGNITWDNVGAGSIPGVHWDGNSVTIDGNVKLASTSGDSVTELLALVQELSSFFQKVNIGTAANPVYAVKVRDEYAGLYSPGFLTAGGVGSGSGGGGGEIDLDRVWESLTNNTDKPDVKINTAHLPNVEYSGTGYVTGASYRTSAGVTYLTLTRSGIAFSNITGQATANQVPNIENLNNFSTRVYDKTATVTPHYVLAGPSSGSAAAATFRALVVADIPDITTSKVSDIETWIGNKGYLTSVAFSDLTSHPTTLSGYGITDAVDSARDLTDADDLLYVDPEEGVTVVIDDPGTTGTVLWGAESANQVALSVNGVSKTLVKYAAIEGLYSSIGVLNGYFSGGAARNALALNGHDSSYFATASAVSALVTGVSSVVGQGGDVTVTQIASALTSAGYKLTDTVYTLPTAGSDALGGIKIGYSASGKNYAVMLDGNDKAYVNVPWTDTVYTLPIASASTLGGMKVGTGLTIDGNGVVSVTGQTQGTVTRVDVGSSQYSPDANGIVGLPAYPTTLPASDVYAWAKKSSLAASDVPNITTAKISDIETWISNKNYLTSVAFSDLTAHPTTIAGYGITDAKFGTAGSDYVPITLGATTVNVLTAHQSLSLYATKQYVDNAIEALPEPMIFKGSLGTGGTITTLPAASASNEGYTYKVITAGTYASQTAKVGDTFISTGTEWVLIPSGDEPEGTVTSVGLSMPTGFSVSSSPITSSGTLTVTFASGYSLPTTAKQSNWDTAYGWGNHANAGYLTSADGTIIYSALQSLQSQIDSVASRNEFDELNASSVFSDIVAATSLYVGSITLGGNDLATTLSNLSGRIETVEGKFTGDSANSALRLSGTAAYSIWGVEYWSSGVPKSVTGRPGLYIGTTQVQTSSAAQDLTGIGSISAAGALTLSTTKKIYFGDTDHFIELKDIGTAGSPNWVFHFSHGLYSEGFVTAGGVGSGSGGGGGSIDLDRVWESLTNNTDKPNVKINVAHIPDLSSIYQPLDADLTAIAGLSGTSGYLKKTAANAWSLISGIPKTDLASAVQTSLGKADSAYQKPSGGIPKSDLSADLYMWLLYSSGDSYALLPSEVGTSSPICVNVTGTDEVFISGLGGYDGDTDNIDSASSVQAVINGKYVKPSGGIPASDLASAVRTSLGKADTAYQKPSGGIPNSDLALDMSWEYVGDSATYDTDDYIHVNS